MKHLARFTLWAVTAFLAAWFILPMVTPRGRPRAIVAIELQPLPRHSERDAPGRARAGAEHMRPPETAVTRLPEAPAAPSAVDPAVAVRRRGGLILDGASGSYLPHQSLWWGSDGRTMFKVSPAPSDQMVAAAEADVTNIRRRLALDATVGTPPWDAQRFAIASDASGEFAVIGRDFEIPSSAEKSALMMLEVYGRVKAELKPGAFEEMVQQISEFEQFRRTEIAAISALVSIREEQAHTPPQVYDFISMGGSVFLVARTSTSAVGVLLAERDRVWAAEATALRQELNGLLQ